MTRNVSDRSFPSVSLTRIALIVLVPVTLLLGVQAMAWAVTLKTWTNGETLTAADLNQNFSNINAQLVAQPPCRAGFWSLGDGRLCMQMTMQTAASMYDNGPTGAIHVCQAVGPGSRVCTFTDFRQACGAGLNPYAGVTTGWYGDHEDNETETHPNTLQGQHWDLEGMYMDGSALTVVGGYDFRDGFTYSGHNYSSGDIFIDVDGDVVYGYPDNKSHGHIVVTRKP